VARDTLGEGCAERSAIDCAEELRDLLIGEGANTLGESVGNGAGCACRWINA